ncbi:phosphopantetheine-binding protein [Streptomyces naphthomycinicus]|uniref:phosphopantetheine-binding protein n=1 Tax=Streptomyces naphthomycinicus TaxID=2872625 RepID=UPI001CED7A86|nr:phosphopantetheine-binding protein [Streptomyces sp. TML10]
MHDDGAEIAIRTRKIMVDVLGLRLNPEDITDEISLYSPRIQLDSLTMLQLLLALEGEFDVQLDDEDVMEADLRTVGDLMQLIQRSVRDTSREGNA